MGTVKDISNLSHASESPLLFFSVYQKTQHGVVPQRSSFRTDRGWYARNRPLFATCERQKTIAHSISFDIPLPLPHDKSLLIRVSKPARTPRGPSERTSATHACRSRNDAPPANVHQPRPQHREPINLPDSLIFLAFYLIGVIDRLTQSALESKSQSLRLLFDAMKEIPLRGVKQETAKSCTSYHSAGPTAGASWNAQALCWGFILLGNWTSEPP